MISGGVYNQWLEKAAMPGLCDGTTCTLTPDINPVAGIYQVYLRAWGPGGFSVDYDTQGWSAPVPLDLSMFTSTPDVTNFISPDGTSDVTTAQPTFSWEGVAGATWYRIWVGKLGPIHQYGLLRLATGI